jgi:hypothetical protein
MCRWTLFSPTYLNCPLGPGHLTTGKIICAPPTWQSGYGSDWYGGGNTVCFVCDNNEGIMVDTPSYSVTVSAYLDGIGTNRVVYHSAPPDVQITIPIKQFPHGFPC